MNLRFVYINMEQDADRRERFLEQFPGPKWWRFPGCRGGLMWGEVARGLGLLGDLRETWSGRLREPWWGNVGCSLSHLFCLRIAAVAHGIVLFPDDATNPHGHDLSELVRSALKHRPPGCGWIKLKNHYPVHAAGAGSCHESGGLRFRRLAAVPRDVKAKSNTGSAAVIILKRQARAILRHLPPVTSNGIDFELRAIVDRIPGGCWELTGTGIGHAAAGGRFKGSSRREINRR